MPPTDKTIRKAIQTLEYRLGHSLPSRLDRDRQGPSQIVFWVPTSSSLEWEEEYGEWMPGWKIANLWAI